MFLPQTNISTLPHHSATRRGLRGLAAATLCGVFATGVVAQDLSSTEMPDDQQIHTRVERELNYDADLWFDTVNATVEDNVVTLQGEVNRLAEKRHAERLAQTVRGVIYVDNQIKVQPLVDHSASQVREEVIGALQRNPATEAFELDVKADDQGQVTLSGEVQSYNESTLAAQVASNIRGVTEVINLIDVNYKVDRNDYEIQQGVKQALYYNGLIDSSGINVVVKDGAVTLSGTVPSLSELRLAETESYVAGAGEVDTEDLKVDPWASPEPYDTVWTAEDARLAIRSKLIFNPSVDASGITLSVDGTKATLRGNVDTLTGFNEAYRSALETKGITRVENLLHISPPDPRDDQTIQDDIESALLTDAIVESYQVTTQVNNGVATLEGTVDSYIEKAQAAEVASDIEGVRRVRNRIDVRNDYDVVWYDPYVYSDMTPNTFDPPADTGFQPLASDAEIENDIEDEFFWSPFVDGEDINVKVNGGVATLQGDVDDAAEWRAASENAYEGGAIAVVNNLNIE